MMRVGISRADIYIFNYPGFAQMTEPVSVKTIFGIVKGCFKT